ncbi:MAG: DUF4149 domain-containing protein [Burkholderiales bacterium]
MEPLLLFVHVTCAAVWVGGMAFAHFCLRPAAFELLPPPQRVPLMVGAMGRFIRIVAAAVVLLWVTGLWRFAQVGAANAPPGWHAMAGIAAVMTVIYAVIAHGVFPRVRAAAADQRWPEAAAGLGRLRSLVAVNLALGLATIAAATLHR